MFECDNFSVYKWTSNQPRTMSNEFFNTAIQNRRRIYLSVSGWHRQKKKKEYALALSICLSFDVCDLNCSCMDVCDSSAFASVNAVAQHVMINICMCLKIQFVIIARTYTHTPAHQHSDNTAYRHAHVSPFIKWAILPFSHMHEYNRSIIAIGTQIHTHSEKERLNTMLRWILAVTLMTTCVAMFFFSLFEI